MHVLCMEAQDEQPLVQVPMNVWQEREQFIKTLQDSIVQLNDSVKRIIQIINDTQKSTEDYSVKNNNANIEIARLNQIILRMQADSIVNLQEKMDLKAEILASQAKIEHADTVTIQLIITYMGMKCSESRIRLLKDTFNSISKQQIKDDYRSWYNLLSLYIPTYNDIKGIAKQASEKIPLTTLLPLREKYINECKNKVQSLEYTKTFYSNKKCTSSYLNEMIELLNNSLSSVDGTYTFDLILSK